MRYKSFDPNAKTIGQSLLGFRAATEKEMIEPLLEKYGLTVIQPDQWYPLQPWLDVLSDISEQTSDYASMLTFVNIGQKVAASTPVRSDADAIVSVRGYIDSLVAFGSQNYYDAFQGNVGTYVIEKVDQNHVKCILQTPFPPDYWYGIIYGFAKLFCKSFVVQYEDMAMRHYGPGETVVIHLIVE